MNKEARLLERLRKMHARRDLLAWRLADLDAKIAASTRELAKERGVMFIRPETVRQELAR